MRKKDLHACSISQWYPLFDNISNKSRKRVTLECKWMELPLNFVHDYLLSDSSIIIPSSMSQKLTPHSDANIEGEAEEFEEQFSDSHFSQELLESMKRVQQFIEDCLEDFNGKVFPKCNWSAPKDATFMLFHQSLKCTSAEEVFLVLRSSDFVIYDMEKVYEGIEDADEEDVAKVLALKPFYDMQPSMEFRCFVFAKKIVGISQREPSQYYSFLKSNATVYENCIQQFFDEFVRDVFPLENYTMDIYINKKQQCFIVDFNVWGDPTLTLLFDSFEELEQIAKSSNPTEPKLRIVDDAKQIIRPTLSQYHGLPIDAYQSSAVPTTSSKEEKQASTTQHLVSLAEQQFLEQKKI